MVTAECWLTRALRRRKRHAWRATQVRILPVTAPLNGVNDGN